MIVISGAVLVLPDRVVDEGSLVIDGDRIAAIEPRALDAPEGATRIDGRGAMVVPGFIDVHVHGIEGIDVLDGPDAVARVAERLPRYGVTAFCPTSVACDPATLDAMLGGVARAGNVRQPAARVLPAHLESNFINPKYKGAQPIACIRSAVSGGVASPAEALDAADFTGADVLEVIAKRRDQVAIVTLAPEIEGGIDLVSQLATAGHRVSIGHSGATYEQALDAIAAGVSHATHLFNRMSPMTHRAPGVPGAVLQSEGVAAELVCDGFHVHPALMRIALRAKGTAGIVAITDGTAGSGLPLGSRTRLGGRPIVVTERTAELEDGTIAGSVLTMDGAFRVLVARVGLNVVDAVRICSTTPASLLRLRDVGRLVAGSLADVAVLDRDTLRVRSTLISGHIWNPAPPAFV
jgi:N-acetylglucosamine-6-phosphate deacetylase